MNKLCGIVPEEYALIVFTPNGYRLAQKTAAALPSRKCAIFAKKDLVDDCHSFERLRDIMPRLFASYNALIFFGAVGIAVRMIAPFVSRKDKDPAVIAIDERAHFAVSVLSGHLGGANELCHQLARLLDAVPVVTTATDCNDLLAPDTLARQYHLQPWPIEQIKKINARLLAQGHIDYYIDRDLPQPLRCFYQRELTKLHQTVAVCRRGDLPPFAVFLTASPTLLPRDCLSLIVPQLRAGIGCRRSTSQSELMTALDKACTAINCSFFNITKLASTIVKQDEACLLKVSKQYALPIKFYDNAALQASIDAYGLTISPFVEKTIGIGNVCEAAALSGKKTKLLLPKTKFKKVTVALTWENFM